ncbi:unnamed protein product [Mucor fragilis]
MKNELFWNKIFFLLSIQHFLQSTQRIINSNTTGKDSIHFGLGHRAYIYRENHISTEYYTAFFENDNNAEDGPANNALRLIDCKETADNNNVYNTPILITYQGRDHRSKCSLNSDSHPRQLQLTYTLHFDRY